MEIFYVLSQFLKVSIVLVTDHVLEIDLFLYKFRFEPAYSIPILFLFIFFQILDPFLGSLILLDDWIVEHIFDEFDNLFELLEW